MSVKFNLDNIIKDLATKLGSTAKKSAFPGDEYILENVTVKKLTDAGFEEKGTDLFEQVKIYKYENLEACLDENNTLRLYQLDI